MKKTTEEPIEVYEWKQGEARPGVDHRISDNVLDHVMTPPQGAVPQIGDVVRLFGYAGDENEDFLKPTPFRVVDREFIWARTPKTKADEPLKNGKTILYVRRLEVDEYADKSGLEALRK